MKVIGIRGNRVDEGANGEAEPTPYIIADSSLLYNRRPFFLPDFAESFVCRPTIVARVCRLGKNIAQRFAGRYYDALTVGITVKALGIKGDFDNGDTGAVAESFDNAAIVGDFIPKEQTGPEAEWELSVDGVTVAGGSAAQLAIGFDGLIERVSRYFTLKTGDMIFASTPRPCHTMKINTLITATLANRPALRFRVK